MRNDNYCIGFFIFPRAQVGGAALPGNAKPYFAASFSARLTASRKLLVKAIPL